VVLTARGAIYQRSFFIGLLRIFAMDINGADDSRKTFVYNRASSGKIFLRFVFHPAKVAKLNQCYATGSTHMSSQLHTHEM
jgi:hypothetical protein